MAGAHDLTRRVEAQSGRDTVQKAVEAERETRSRVDATVVGGHVASVGRVLPRVDKSAQPCTRHRSRVLGGRAAAGCVTALLLPLIDLERSTAPVRWWLLAVAALLLGALAGRLRHRRRTGREPLIDVGLLRTRSFGVGGAIGLAYFAGYAGLVFVLSLYLQQGRGYWALAAGATGTPFAIGSAITAATGGRLVYRLGRAMVIVGLTAVLLGLAGTAVIVGLDTRQALWLDLLGPLLVAGLGSGLVIGPNQTLALRQVPRADGGTAAAVLQTGQRIGRSLGVAVAGTLYFGHLSGARGGYPDAAGDALWGGVALVAVALAIASADVSAVAREGSRPPGRRPRRSRAPATGAPRG